MKPLVHPSNFNILTFNSQEEALEHFKLHGDFLDRNTVVKDDPSYFFIKVEDDISSNKTFFVHNWFNPTSLPKNSIYVLEDTYSNADKAIIVSKLPKLEAKFPLPKELPVPIYANKPDLLQTVIALELDLIETIRYFKDTYKRKEVLYTHPSKRKIWTFNSELEAERHFKKFNNFLGEPDNTNHPYFWVLPKRTSTLIYKKYPDERKCWNLEDLPAANNTATPNRIIIPLYQGELDLLQAAVAYKTTVQYVIDSQFNQSATMTFINLDSKTLVNKIKDNKELYYKVYLEMMTKAGILPASKSQFISLLENKKE